MYRLAGHFLADVAAVAALLILVLAVPIVAANVRADVGDANGTSIQSVNRTLKGDQIRIAAAPDVQLMQTPRRTSPSPPECQSEADASPFAPEVPGRCVG
jgi:hypothetical protein